jgi:hypothetical protein
MRSRQGKVICVNCEILEESKPAAEENKTAAAAAAAVLAAAAATAPRANPQPPLMPLNLSKEEARLLGMGEGEEEEGQEEEEQAVAPARHTNSYSLTSPMQDVLTSPLSRGKWEGRERLR